MTLLVLFLLPILSKHHTPAGAKAVTVSDTSKAVAYLANKPTKSVASMPGTDGETQSVAFLPKRRIFLTTDEMAGGGLAITYGLFESDDEVYETLRGIRMRSNVLSGVSPIVSTMGLGTFSVALFGGFYVFHFITNGKISLRTANLGMESFLLSGVATQVLKNMFGRERPSMATSEGGRWSGPLSYFEHRDHGSRSIASYDAFPSGHTATIFAAAATIADSYPEKWVSYAAYGTATLVGISRVMERAHWPSDVFVGAIIGIASTKIVENLPFNRKNSKLKLSLYGGPTGVGFSFVF